MRWTTCSLARSTRAALRAVGLSAVVHALPHGLDTPLAPGAPQLHEAAPGNVCFRFARGDEAAVGKAFESAAHVVRLDLVNNRLIGAALEPRAVVAAYDEGRGHFTVYACMQRPYIWRTLMTQDIFRIPEHDMTLIAGDVGGSFGMKGGLYPEVPVAAWAARRLGRPVKWTCERSEAMLADYHDRDHISNAEIALDRDGRFLAVRVSNVTLPSASMRMKSPALMVMYTAGLRCVCTGVRSPAGIHVRITRTFSFSKIS